MNEDKIEELLRKAPKSAPPGGLQQRLQRAVRLPQPADSFEYQSWTRRWIPALSFAVLLFACMVAFGVQVSTINQLKRQNEELRAAPQKSQASATDSEYRRLQTASQELQRLRKDKAELEALQKEVADLRTKVAGLEPLRVENQRLRTEIANRQASMMAAAANLTPEQLEQERAKAEKAKCINNMKQLGLAARVWASDNNDIYPSDYVSMTNELNNWQILYCPSDKSRSVNSWTDVAAGNVSYRMISPGITENWPTVVYAVCPIHGNVTLVDGSVQALGSNWQQQVKTVDGKMFYEPAKR